MRNKEVHGNVFTVHVLIDLVTDRLRQQVGVKISVVFVKESSASQHHAEFAAVVGVVVPRTVGIPSVITTRETNDLITMFTPNPKTEEDFVVPEMRVIVNGKHRFSLDGIVWQEPVVEGVPR